MFSNSYFAKSYYAGTYYPPLSGYAPLIVSSNKFVGFIGNIGSLMGRM